MTKMSHQHNCKILTKIIKTFTNAGQAKNEMLQYNSFPRCDMFYHNFPKQNIKSVIIQEG